MKYLKNLVYLFFPEACLVCNNNLKNSEKYLCVNCLHDLPLSNYTNMPYNEVEKSFLGRVKIISATSLLLYNKKSKVQKLIYQLKYKNQQQIGDFLGNWLGEEMILSERFKNIDYVIPVPLHQKKLKLRGYNQVEKFGKSIAKKINAVYVDNILLKINATSSQTKKHRFERFKNVNEIFYLNNLYFFKNKHVLLVDDIITTGATLESCCLELLKTPDIKISIATMAFTI